MPRQYVRHKPKPEHRLPDATIAMIRRLLGDGVGPSEIARSLRVGRMTVWRVQQKMTVKSGS